MRCIQVLRVTVASLWNHGLHADIQSHGVGVIATACDDKQLCATASRFAGAGAIVAALRQFPSDDEVRWSVRHHGCVWFDSFVL
jgi:hypothetical protein